MYDDWVIVYQCDNKLSCSDRALVLHSVGIPHQILDDGSSIHVLVVPPDAAEKAKFEIWEYEQENRPAKPSGVAIKPQYETAVSGVIVYLLVVVVIGWMSGQASFGQDWYGAGRVDGSLIEDGEWWRVVTALTLHGSIKHILGNIVFGLLFGILAGGLLGPGVAWLAIVVAGGLGNALNVLLLDSAHRSIGASTAVFGALGLVSGFVWRAKLMAQDRWAWRLGPIVGGFALLAYTGTGDANTDVGAHLAGFVCGFGGGMILSPLAGNPPGRRWQFMSGAAALALIMVAWAFALQSWNSV